MKVLNIIVIVVLVLATGYFAYKYHSVPSVGYNSQIEAYEAEIDSLNSALVSKDSIISSQTGIIIEQEYNLLSEKAKSDNLEAALVKSNKEHDEEIAKLSHLTNSEHVDLFSRLTSVSEDE